MLCRGEFLINLQMMAHPSEAMILDVLTTDKDWVKIDGRLKRRSQVGNKSKHHPGKNAITENCIVFYSLFLQCNCLGEVLKKYDEVGDLWKEESFLSYPKSCDFVRMRR